MQGVSRKLGALGSPPLVRCWGGVPRVSGTRAGGTFSGQELARAGWWGWARLPLAPKDQKRGLGRFQLIEAESKSGGLIKGNYPPRGAPPPPASLEALRTPARVPGPPPPCPWPVEGLEACYLPARVSACGGTRGHVPKCHTLSREQRRPVWTEATLPSCGSTPRGAFCRRERTQKSQGRSRGRERPAPRVCQPVAPCALLYARGPSVVPRVLGPGISPGDTGQLGGRPSVSPDPAQSRGAWRRVRACVPCTQAAAELRVLGWPGRRACVALGGGGEGAFLCPASAPTEGVTGAGGHVCGVGMSGGHALALPGPTQPSWARPPRPGLPLPLALARTPEVPITPTPAIRFPFQGPRPLPAQVLVHPCSWDKSGPRRWPEVPRGP